MCTDTTGGMRSDMGHDEALWEIRTGVPNLIWRRGEGGPYLQSLQDVARRWMESDREAESKESHE